MHTQMAMATRHKEFKALGAHGAALDGGARVEDLEKPTERGAVTIFPEQTEVFRRYLRKKVRARARMRALWRGPARSARRLRGCARADVPPPPQPPPRHSAQIATFERSNYLKQADLVHRGKMDSTGFSDYLWSVQQLFLIDIGSNGGHRCQAFRSMAMSDFAPVFSSSMQPLLLWNVEACVQKHSSAGRAAPHPIVDAGVNEGVIKRYQLLCSHRAPTLSAEPRRVDGVKVPGPARAMFLKPLDKVQLSSKNWWKDDVIGKNSLNPFKHMWPVLHGSIPGSLTECPTLHSLRKSHSTYLPEAGAPADITAAVTGP